MALKDVLKKGSGAPAPADLITGGIGVDTVNKRLYFKADDGTVVPHDRNTPAGDIVATTVQGAINELDTEKAPLASPTFTGTVNTANLAYTGTLTGSTGVVAIGTNQIYKDASGNVGIGTSSPTAKAQIGDLIVVTTNRLVFGKAQTASESNLPAIGQQSAGVGNDLALAATSTSGSVRLYTGASTNSGEIGTGSNAPRMTIDPSGNVGIGTTAPQGKLDVQGDINLAFPCSVGFSLSSQTFTLSGATAPTYGLGINNYTGGAEGSVALSGYYGVLLATANVERMRITSAGSVGIGYATPANTLHVANVGDTQIRVSTPTNNFYFDMGRSSADGLFQINGNQGLGYKWLNAGIERMRIDNVGNVTLQENISVGGAAPTTSGTGITFPAAVDVSSNANTLDDYEEGTWTPTYTGFTITAGTSSTRYTKVGRMITANIQINASSVSCTAAATFTLPIAATTYSTGVASTTTASSAILVTGAGATVIAAIGAAGNLALTVTYQLAS